jgi:hypothetical protein
MVLFHLLKMCHVRMSPLLAKGGQLSRTLASCGTQQTKLGLYNPPPELPNTFKQSIEGQLKQLESDLENGKLKTPTAKAKPP